ncbi:MAG: crossover junction endodeoxyribonuclease RuvC [Endomicrobium sp.]|jgi:crossover junction endodeoxyribonuclease RuvC|nr:crossover junction endodeoxyribonuclease RuvC [Endomicrobium sp.]
MIILGIDPGIALTGWCIINAYSRDKIELLNSGCIKTFSYMKITERLFIIYNELQKIIDTYKPDVASLEEIFFFKKSKTIAFISQARGAIILTIAINNILLFEYNPKLVKIALTGNGKACKLQMQQMVKFIFKLKTIPKPDDIADAIAIAICHINSIRWN